MLSSEGTSFRPMRGEFIGDDGCVFTLGSFSSVCLAPETILPLRGRISSAHISLALAEAGLS